MTIIQSRCPTCGGPCVYTADHVGKRGRCAACNVPLLLTPDGQPPVLWTGPAPSTAAGAPLAPPTVAGLAPATPSPSPASPAPSVLQTTCPKCASIMQFKSENIGKRAKCAKCGEPLMLEDRANILGHIRKGVRTWLERLKAPASRRAALIPAAIIGVVILLIGLGTCFGPGGSRFNGSKDGLTREQLGKTSHTIVGKLRVPGILGLGSQEWTGSAGVIGGKDGRLTLISNSHCLNLAATNADLEEYSLKIIFASGAERDVIRFADHAGSLDLAMLEVDSSGLKEGVDYVVLPYPQRLELLPGDDVVAIGSPLGLPGTQTFGKISAVRDRSPDGSPARVIQIDAPVNHGNSGGPLMLQKGDKYLWIGVNTFKISKENAEGLAFAIDSTQAVKSEYNWFSADTRGAINAKKK